LREPSPNKFKEDADLKSQFSPILHKVKRKLEYNSPLKERLLAHTGGVAPVRSRALLRATHCQINNNMKQEQSMEVDQIASENIET